MSTDDLLALVPGHLPPDTRQDAILALLEANVSTEAEAEAVIRKVRNRNQYLARRERAHTTAVDDMEQLVESEDSTPSDELADLLHSIIAELPGDQAQLLRWLYMDGLHVDVCAYRLRCSPATIYRRAATAIATLRLFFSNA